MVQTTNNSTETLQSTTLSIQVGLNGFSFCTINSENKITALKHENFGIQLSPEQVLDKIKYAFAHNSYLKYNFSKIEVIHQNNLYSLIPKASFDPESLKEYLQYNIKVLSNDFIAYDELDQHEIMLAYIPYTNINNFFFENFGSFIYKHASTILIDNLLAKEKNSETVTVFAHINSKSFDLIIIDKGKLILGNSYTYETKEDFLYYLMFTTEQLGLNPEEFRLRFLGDISKNSDCYNIAYKYIRSVDFGSKNNAIKTSKDIKFIEPHEHFVLLSHF